MLSPTSPKETGDMNGPIKHKSVEDLMTETVVSVAPAASFKDMATLLHRHRVSALPVVDHENKVLESFRRPICS